MALRRLSRIEIGVREDALDATRAFHRDFGLHEIAAGRFATAEGGDALGRTSASLAKLGVECERDGDSLRTREPLTGARVALEKPRPTRLSTSSRRRPIPKRRGASSSRAWAFA